MRLEEIDSNWTAPDGLGYSGLRPVRLRRPGYAMAVFAVLFLAGGVVLGFVLWNQSQRQEAARQELERDGVAAPGRIVRLWHTGGKSDTPRVAYVFSIQGSERSGTSDVPSRTWKTLQVGDSLEVRYVAASPSINHPAGWRMPVTPFWLALLIPLIVALCSCLMVFQVRRQWRLLTEGRPAPGVVTKTRRTDKQTVVHYEFRILSGAVKKGRSAASRRSAPAVGSVVCVMYDPENPGRNAVYPFQMVKLDTEANGHRA